MDEQRFYVFRIDLVGGKPPIWRRFVVPADITLKRLHVVIQIVMGWQGGHLHEFEIKGRRYSVPHEDDFEETFSTADYRLCDLMKRKGTKFSYVYDFGDWWEHKLTLEDNNYVMDASDKEKTFVLKGKRACPPEDIGGMWGYANFLQELKDPDPEEHEEDEEFSEWAAEKLDPEAFDSEHVNQILANYLKEGSRESIDEDED